MNRRKKERKRGTTVYRLCSNRIHNNAFVFMSVSVNQRIREEERERHSFSHNFIIIVSLSE